MATQDAPSMLNTLQKILGLLATAQIAQDADPDFLSKLQAVIVARIKQGAQSQTGGPGQQAGPPGGGQAMPPPGGIPGVPGAGPGPSALIPGQPGGMGNMDEIRRLLSQGHQGGQGGGVLPGQTA